MTAGQQDKPPVVPSSLALLLLPHSQNWRESSDGPAQLLPHQRRLRCHLMGAGEEWDGASAAEPAASRRNHRIMGEFEGTFKGHLVQPPCSEQGHLQPLFSVWIRALVYQGLENGVSIPASLGKGVWEQHKWNLLAFLPWVSLGDRAPHSFSLKNPSPAVSLLLWSC